MFLFSSNFCHFCIQNTMIKHDSSYLCLDTHMPDIPTDILQGSIGYFSFFHHINISVKRLLGSEQVEKNKVRTLSTSINTRSSKALEQLFKNTPGSVLLSVPCRRQDMNRLLENKLSPGFRKCSSKKMHWQHP